ncbi:MAG: hypothetical protein M3071_11315 [Actinomycetota bacterium]|nr:hypothetical protein [Actinomycetota bacterium]
MSAADVHPPRSDPDDGRVLAFIAAHRLVLASHVQELLNVGHQAAHERLSALEERRLVRRCRVSRGHGYYQITEIGLGVIGSDLPPPRVRLDRCRHDVGVAWVWIAADRRAFGRVDRVLTEREQRSHDASRTHPPSPDRPDDPLFGLRVAGNPTALHYPDLLLLGRKGERVPVELMLTSGGQRQLQTLMASYGAEQNISAVLYLTETPAIRDTTKRMAAELGIEDLIWVRTVTILKDAQPAAAQ